MEFDSIGTADRRHGNGVLEAVADHQRGLRGLRVADRKARNSAKMSHGRRSSSDAVLQRALVPLGLLQRNRCLCGQRRRQRAGPRPRHAPTGAPAQRNLGRMPRGRRDRATCRGDEGDAHLVSAAEFETIYDTDSRSPLKWRIENVHSIDETSRR